MYSGVFNRSAGHADFNNRMICTLHSFVTACIMPMIAGVIPTILYNSLHWSKSCCNVWNVRWTNGVINSLNVGGNQWDWLLWPSCSGRKEMISGRWCSRKECPWRHDFSEEGVSSGKTRRCSWGVFCFAFPVAYLQKFLMGWDRCLNVGVGQKLPTTYASFIELNMWYIIALDR